MAIVHSQVGECRIQHDQILNRVDDVNMLAVPTNTNGQANAAEIFHHANELEHMPIRCLVELEVNRPHVVRVFRANQHTGADITP